MRLASRLDTIDPYVFAAMQKRIEEKAAQGIEVINLGSGDPDTPTCPGVVHAAQLAVNQPANQRYPTNRGKASFLKAAAQFLEIRFGVSLDPVREIAPALGGKEAVHHAGFCVLNPDDICLYPEPAYPIYKSATALAQANSHVLNLTAEHKFLPDLESIPSSVAKKAKLLYLNYPNNPTGALADVDFFDRVVAYAKQHDIIVVHDNAYSEIAYDGYSPPSFLQAKGAKDVGVEIFSLSKGWNMTGWRIGFIAGNSKLVEAMLHLKPNIDAGPFGAIQDAATAALTTERDFPRHMSKLYQERRDIIVPVLRRIGLQLDVPKATLFLWARIPSSLNSRDVASRIFDETAVLLSPGSAFGPSGEGYIRLALTASTERLVDAAKRLDSLRLL